MERSGMGVWGWGTQLRGGFFGGHVGGGPTPPAGGKMETEGKPGATATTVKTPGPTAFHVGES